MNEGKDGGQKLAFPMAHCILWGICPIRRVVAKEEGEEMPGVQYATLAQRS